MKFLLQLVVLALLGQGALAGEVSFYVAGSQGVYRGGLDTETGKLGKLTLAGAAKSPNFLALSPDGKILYATLDSPGEGVVADFFVEPDGTLSPLDALPSGGAGACHLSL